jgi:YVTN family beta-propeller protein
MSPSGTTAYIVNTISGTVTPIDVATGDAGRSISVGLYSYPVAIAITPAGTTAEVVGSYAGEVTPINLTTRRGGPAISVGQFPVAVVMASH